MDRRAFLKSTGAAFGVLTAGGLLAACGDGGGGAAGGAPDAVTAEADPANPPAWNVINASYELLTGTEQRFAFALTQTDNSPVERDDVEVWIRTPEREVLGGPFPVTSYGRTDVGLPLYRTLIDIPEPGVIEIVAVAGEEHGVTAMEARAPETSEIPVPGQAAIAVATPTGEEDLGLVAVCTRDPACDMHDVSLDEALEAGRPVVLMFATPAYCQTAVCGPGVDTLQEIAASQDWGDIAFIHAEIFTDEGQTVADHVREWGLPSEPWLFTIDGEGQIVRRLDGPMIAEELREVTAELA